jgi:hypothetical protein
MSVSSAATSHAPASLEETGRAVVDRAELPAIEPPQSCDAWNGTTCLALVALVAVWAAKFYSTWAAWGNLTIDSGHEMYVPAMLAEGKLLYRDVWFMYGPASPYFNSLLYRLFGERLGVLYWAGSLSALGSAVFVYLAGMRLSSWRLGWTAGAVVVLQAFQPSLFCFPLPYSFAAVYGCLVACLFLWLTICASASENWWWLFGAATAAALGLELKPEFGMACYATLGLLLVARSVLQRSWKPIARGIIAALPGVLVCGLTVAWMISIRGVEFITQENIVSWPTTYFMKTYSKIWLERNGFSLTPSAFYEAGLRTIPLLGAAGVAYSFLWWRRSDARSRILRAGLILAVALSFAAKSYLPFSWREFCEVVLTPIFFPLDMVLYVGAGALAAWWLFWRRPGAARNPALPLLLSYASLLAFRILMGMRTAEYPIYYNGPVVLAFLLLACWIIPRSGRLPRFVLVGQSVICLGCLTAVFFAVRTGESYARDYVPLATERGTVRASPNLVKNYEAAIRFMKEKAALGESVLSVPEDTSLYFLSGTRCPIRVYSFTPGVIAPGKMTQDVIREIEEKRVRYLLWSNRIFPEFHTPVFGEDFDREIGQYLRSHYRREGRLVPGSPMLRDWTAVIWERKPESDGK